MPNFITIRQGEQKNSVKSLQVGGGGVEKTPTDQVMILHTWSI